MNVGNVQELQRAILIVIDGLIAFALQFVPNCSHVAPGIINHTVFLLLFGGLFRWVSNQL